MMLLKSEVESVIEASEWQGKSVLVIGAARQGIALARYLTSKGADVTVNDRRNFDQLTKSREGLKGASVHWLVGGHPVSVLDGIEIVFISGGVPSDLPLVMEASKRGIPISNDTHLFLEICPCKVVGITGSAGKTTTTTLLGLIAEAAVNQANTNIQHAKQAVAEITMIDPASKVWVGGNIGLPLISIVDQIKPNDLAIMELSSFQLEIMQNSPAVAAILNITPNHLDRHVSMNNYISAKSRIIKYQTSQDVAVLNIDDEIVRNLREDVHGHLIAFGMHESTRDEPSVFFDPISQYVQSYSPSQKGGESVNIINRSDIPLRGDHNLMNVIAACGIAMACGISPEAMQSGIKKFAGIEHRLEFVLSWGGGDWYNDSIATAPERAIAAIKAFTEPIILLAGGRDKDLPWDGFASLVSARVKHLIVFGESAGVISSALSKYTEGSQIVVTYCSGLEEAVKTAAEIVAEGDVVLLSPGGTSFDEFNDFEERGEAYKKWVMELV